MTASKNSLYFELQNNGEAMAAFIEGLPEQWPRVAGRLIATPIPELTVDTVAAGTCIYFDELRGISIGSAFKGPLDLCGFLGDGERAEQYEFSGIPGYTGYYWGATAKRVVAALLRKGYRGNLFLQETAYYSSSTHLLKACDIKLGEWANADKYSNEGVGDQPPRVHIFYDEHERQTWESIGATVDYCQYLGLREYQPKVAKAA